MKFIIFLLSIIFLANCEREPLKITKVELCGYFTSNGECKESLPENVTYEIKVPFAKRFENWNSLANYMYFKSKQTPGFVIHFNRKFSIQEREILKKTYKSYYEFAGSTGEVEGEEIGENWIGSFQYMGSIIKDRQRERNEGKTYPLINSIFPSKLLFKYSSELFDGDIKTQVNLNVQYEY
ncbi:MAG: hypothetical protein KDK36_00605 [Leptospiraceae bacterium]|nr:hypothetical protein [Leptospiraceae bacterium]